MPSMTKSTSNIWNHDYKIKYGTQMSLMVSYTLGSKLTILASSFLYGFVIWLYFLFCTRWSTFYTMCFWPCIKLQASKKIADAKLAKDFQAVLKEFQKAQRLAAEREAAYAPFITQAGLPQSYNSTEVNNGADRLAEQRTQLLESRRQELVFLDNEIVFNEAIIEERDQGIQEIQHQITEVNEIFKDLAVLVHDQGALIGDVDYHIENSVASTAQAKAQLSKAAKTQKSNSSLICLLMVIFGVVLLIVIIVLAA